jgi:hypothetical protein
LFWIADGMFDGAEPPGFEGVMDAGEDIGGEQLGIPSFDSRQRVECHGCAASFREEAAGVSKLDVFEPIDVGSEFVPNEAKETSDPAHGFARFVNCFVCGEVASN